MTRSRVWTVFCENTH